MKMTLGQASALGLILVVVLSLLAGCAPAATPTNSTAPVESSEAAAALKCSGDRSEAMSWTMDQLKSMEVVTVHAAQPNKDAKDYRGVRLNALLDLAAIGGEGTLSIIAANGYETELSLADVRSCADCLVGFQNTQGGLRMVMPDLPGNAWVKGVIEMRVEAAAAPASEKPAEPEYAHSADRLVLATTTSTENSGLLKYVLPNFKDKYGITVQVVAVGTGQALKLGEDGNADVVLVHARAREDAFVDSGFGVVRKDVMYNDFVLVGPEADPAGLQGMTDIAAAFAKIAEAEALFVSRGDDSGTHTKEKEIWAKAGIEPVGAWYIAAGQGMGAVLTMSNEQQAYSLCDRATYLAMTKEGLDIDLLVESDPILFNPYGVIAVNPERYPDINYDLAMEFVEWLTSVETQEMIAVFGTEDFGQPLFVPDSEEWRAAKPAAAALTLVGAV